MTLKKPATAACGKSGEIKETIQVCTHLTAILRLPLSGVMLQGLCITVMLSKHSNRAAEASKQKALCCTECSISVSKLPEIPREQKLYCIHLDKFLSTTSNDLKTLYQCVFEIDWGGCVGTTSPINQNKLLPGWYYMECCYAAA